LVLAVCKALREVRAQYCSPGSTTRPQKKRVDDKDEQSLFVSSLHDVKDVAASRGSQAQIESYCDANVILEKAPIHVAIGLYRMSYFNDTLKSVAESMGMSRYKLRRDIDAYASLLRRNIPTTSIKTVAL
jgi:hypothetical protein